MRTAVLLVQRGIGADATLVTLNPGGSPQVTLVWVALQSTPDGDELVTAHLSEGQIARPLGDIQNRYPHIDLGSYPFYRKDRYGTTLVMRGSVEPDLDAMLEQVKQMIVDFGETPTDETRG